MDRFRPESSPGLASIRIRSPRLSKFVVLCFFCFVLIFKYRNELNVDSSGNPAYQLAATASTQKVSRHERPFCSRSQLQVGKWIKANISPAYHSDACHNREYRATDSYEWEPQDHLSCVFVPWDTAKFCSLLKGAPILLVGDSLTFEHYVALVNTLGGKTAKLLQHRSVHNRMTIVQSVCDHQQTFVMYRRDDKFSNLDRHLNETFPVVLILNRGAHYAPDQQLSSEVQTTFLQVQAWQRRCRDNGIKCHFFWRTTVPGHPNCGNFTQPVNNISVMEDMIANGESPKQYNWPAFKHQNELVLDQLEKSNLEGYHIIDAYHSNILRPDQHARPIKPPGARGGPDCLHSCSPGKVDVYNRFLFHSLLQSRTLEDASVLERFAFPWNRTSNIQPDGHDIIY
jgi:hypothetical protein